jgi:hypothetical protein
MAREMFNYEPSVDNSVSPATQHVSEESQTLLQDSLDQIMSDSPPAWEFNAPRTLPNQSPASNIFYSSTSSEVAFYTFLHIDVPGLKFIQLYENTTESRAFHAASGTLDLLKYMIFSDNIQNDFVVRVLQAIDCHPGLEVGTYDLALHDVISARNFDYIEFIIGLGRPDSLSHDTFINAALSDTIVGSGLQVPVTIPLFLIYFYVSKKNHGTLTVLLLLLF